MTAQYDATVLTIPENTISQNGVGTIAYETMWSDAPKKLDDNLTIPVRVVLRALLDENGDPRPDGFEIDLDELEFQVMQMLRENLYNSNFGLALDSVELKQRLSHTHWFFKLNYKKEDRKSASKKPTYTEAVENWDFSGTSMIVTQSTKAVARYGPGGKDAAPDYKGLIGWDDTRLQGVSVDYAVCRLSLRFLKAGSEVNMAYKKSIYELYNCVNGATFRDFEPGVLLFLGGTLQQREDGDYDITFNFIPEKTQRFTQIGEATGGDGGDIVVPPHHYVWTKHEPFRGTFENENGDNEILKLQKAKYAYVHEMRESGDFTALQIP